MRLKFITLFSFDVSDRSGNGIGITPSLFREFLRKFDKYVFFCEMPVSFQGNENEKKHQLIILIVTSLFLHGFSDS